MKKSIGILIAGSGATPRVDFVCDPNADSPHTLQQSFNTACLADVPKGVIRPENTPRNGIRGPGYQKWDLSLFTNWASIRSPLGSATFGQVTAARDPRIAQLALKLSF